MSLVSTRQLALGLLAAVAAALVPAPARAQSTLKAGTEFRVNEYANGDQRLPVAAVAPDGTFLVVWESQFQDGDSFGIFGRFISPLGVPLGPEFQINQATASDQKQPAVTVDASGRFTVAWTGQDVSGGGVFARQYTAAGPVGPEFQVNTFTAGDQVLPRVSAGPGGFGIVWQSDGQDGNLGGVYGRLFSAGGTPVTGEFRLSTPTAGNQALPVVAALDNGRYAVAWAELQFSSITAIYSRLFDGGGTAVNADRAQSGGMRRDHLTIAAAPGGTFIVAWWGSFTQGGKDAVISTDFGTLLNYHDASGVPFAQLGGLGAGTGSIARWQGALGVNMRARALVAYTSTPNALTCFVTPNWPGPNPCTANGAEDGSGSGVFARPAGAPGLPDRVLVNATTTGDQSRPAVASDIYGNSLVAWQSANQDGSGLGVYAQRFGGFLPVSVGVDPAGNGVLDPGVDEIVRPSWRNQNGAPQAFGGSLFGFVGPAGVTYSVVDGTAAYGTVANGATQVCADCYLLNASLPGARPATHIDSFIGETLTPGPVNTYTTWALHLGGSFGDVSSASPFYRFVETLLHNGITSGCGGGSYCPASATSRDQMSVFVLLARHGAAYLPPACTTPMFADVPASSPFCRWIEELARRGVAGGCGGGNFCPGAAVTREQMAVFVLRTLDPALDPPACTTPMFADVPASSPFCRWIEELARRGVVGGCGGGNYCPTAAVTREQMAVFLSATFSLRLY
jgi:hypothetical protein